MDRDEFVKARGRDFFVEIGRKGGSGRKKQLTDAGTGYTDLGQQGGKETLKRLGVEHFRAIGRLGGAARGRKK